MNNCPVCGQVHPCPNRLQLTTDAPAIIATPLFLMPGVAGASLRFDGSTDQAAGVGDPPFLFKVLP